MSMTTAADTDWFKFLFDWRTCDFYKYNPVKDITKEMNYAQYRAGRIDGSIPAPDHAEVLRDELTPIIATPDDV